MESCVDRAAGRGAQTSREAGWAPLSQVCPRVPGGGDTEGGGIILAAGLQGQRGDGRNRSRGAQGLAAVSVGDGASGVFNVRTRSAPAHAGQP